MRAHVYITYDTQEYYFILEKKKLFFYILS